MVKEVLEAEVGLSRVGASHSGGPEPHAGPKVPSSAPLLCRTLLEFLLCRTLLEFLLCRIGAVFAERMQARIRGGDRRIY